MKILVCGGAGYIGSHMVQLLTEQAHQAVVLDNLSTGHADAVADARVLVGDVLNSLFLDTVFTNHGPFDLVIQRYWLQMRAWHEVRWVGTRFSLVSSGLLRRPGASIEKMTTYAIRKFKINVLKGISRDVATSLACRFCHDCYI